MLSIPHSWVNLYGSFHLGCLSGGSQRLKDNTASGLEGSWCSCDEEHLEDQKNKLPLETE